MQFLIALIGLGVAIDYSLIVVSRWREERAHGRSGDEAIQKAMETGGRAVVFSGITVAIGLLADRAAAAVPALDGLRRDADPARLCARGDHAAAGGDGQARPAARLAAQAHRRQASRAWTRWAETVSRRRWVAAGAGIAVILALAFAATDLQLGSSDADTMAKSGDAKDGLVALEKSGIGEGALLPHEVLIEGSTDPDQVAADLRGVEGIHGAVAPDGPDWRRGTARFSEAVQTPDSGSDEGEATLAGVRDVAHAAGDDVRVGGARRRTTTSSTPSTGASR